MAAVITMRKLILLLPLCSLLSVSANATPALADASTVIADCNANGYLAGHYPRAALQGALNGMGADVREYTNCYDVIRRALLATVAGAGRGGGGGGRGATSDNSQPSPAKAGGRSHRSRGAAAAVSTRGVYSNLPVGTPSGSGSGSRSSVALAGGTVTPGGSAVGAGADQRSLPAPLVVVLIMLGLAGAASGGLAVRRRVAGRSG